MSLKISFHLQTHLLQARISQPTCLLPFLYQTRTLQSPCTTRTGHRRPLGTTASRASREYVPFEGDYVIRPYRKPKDRPSFRDDHEGHPPETPFAPHKTRNTTITGPERAVFDRIFKDIVKSTPGESEDNILDDDLGIGIDQDDDISSIFEQAIELSRIEDERAAKKMQKHLDRNENESTRSWAIGSVPNPGNCSTLSPYTPKLSAAPARVSGVVTGERESGQRDLVGAVQISSPLQENALREGLDGLGIEYEQKVETARWEDRIKVMGLLTKAKNDVEIWNVLKSEVFSLVKRYNLQTQEKEAQKISAVKAIKSVRKRKARPVRGESVTQPQIGATSTKDESKESQPDEEVPILSILQTNYSLNVLDAFRMLRKQFPTSPYALSIIPTIKSLGPVSYVLGASTSIYNEALFLRWVYYKDLNGVADLLREMMEQGVEANEATHAISRDVITSKKLAKRSQNDSVLSAWWQMRGVEEARQRVNGYHRWVTFEVTERQKRRERERVARIYEDEDAQKRVVFEKNQRSELERVAQTYEDEDAQQGGGVTTYPMPESAPEAGAGVPLQGVASMA
ncbi:hypothetical protein MMC12_003899 [Toensbergia leucococca]|nr:hypothetical protein [Toensbergia leucococca]